MFSCFRVFQISGLGFRIWRVVFRVRAMGLCRNQNSVALFLVIDGLLIYVV